MPRARYKVSAVAVLVWAAVLLLPGCGPARSDQTPAQVQAEMGKLDQPRLGLWALNFEVQELDAPGAPAEQTAVARRELEARGRLGQLMCLTKETLAAARIGQVLGRSDMFCPPPIYFKVDGAAYDGVWLCRSRFDDATVEAQGTSSAEQDVAIISANASIPGTDAGRFTVVLRQTAQYRGECPKD